MRLGAGTCRDHRRRTQCDGAWRCCVGRGGFLSADAGGNDAAFSWSGGLNFAAAGFAAGAGSGAAGVLVHLRHFAHGGADLYCTAIAAGLIPPSRLLRSIGILAA